MSNIREGVRLVKLILRKITGKAEDTSVTISVSFRVFLMH